MLEKLFEDLVFVFLISFEVVVTVAVIFAGVVGLAFAIKWCIKVWRADNG